MSLYDTALSLLTSRRVPAFLLRGIVRTAVGILRARMVREDRRQAAAPPTHPAPAGPLYLVDGYHGGVVFWDWLVLPGGGLWYLYNWPLCLQPAVERALQDPRFKVVLDLDAFTFEEMARKAPAAIRQMQEALRAGRLEIVNGTYAQPLALSVSGEALIRHLAHGLDAIRRTLGAEVEIFYSQEPACFPQLPQILGGFGFRGVVLRTQWAAFGTDPACDASVVRWQGPDGSVIPTVPRYTFQHYDRLRADHPGLPNMALAAGEKPDWHPSSLAAFEAAARQRGIAHPLATDLKDTNLPDAPLSCAFELAAMDNVRFVTLTEYFRQVPEEGPRVSWGPDDIPSTLPWGLQGEVLIRARTEAEGALLLAERLDAVAYLLGRESEAARLAEAWKHLCLAQHHDLHVCGPWHSRRHGKSMAEVGVEFADAARQAAEEVSHAALEYLAGYPDGDLVVFNPSLWPRREYGEVPIYLVEGRINPLHRTNPVLHGAPPALQLVDDGEEIPCQWVPVGEGEWRVGFTLDLPALGYRALRLAPRQSAPGNEPFRNPWYEATVHPDGSLTLEAEGRPLVGAGNFFTVWRDGAWHDSRRSVRRVEVVEDGPVYRRFLVEGEIAGVAFRQTVTLYRELARIDGCLVLDFGPEGVYLGPQPEDEEPGRAMAIQDEKKLCLAFASPLRTVWCDSPFLVHPTRMERVIGLHGVGLEDEGGRGVALFHRGTPGYHLDVQNGLLCNVLAWGPRRWVYASDNSITRGKSRYTALRGRHRYEYAILPYTRRLEALRAALDFRLPVQGRWTAGPPGGRTGGSFLTVEPEEVLPTALFVDGGRVYLRLWNASEREIRATVRMNGEATVRPVNLRLQEVAPPLPDGVPLPPWGIQTVEIVSGDPGEPAQRP